MTYSEAIKSSPVVLVEFFATWCPHCQRMMPIMAKITKDLKGKVAVFQYDIDENNALANQENISGIPTFIIYENGTETWRQSGELSEDQILSHLPK